MNIISSIIVAITLGFAQPVTMDGNGNIPPDGQMCITSAVGGYNTTDPHGWKRWRGEGALLVSNCGNWSPQDNWSGDQGYIR